MKRNKVKAEINKAALLQLTQENYLFFKFSTP